VNKKRFIGFDPGFKSLPTVSNSLIQAAFYENLSLNLKRRNEKMAKKTGRTYTKKGALEVIEGIIESIENFITEYKDLEGEDCKGLTHYLNEANNRMDDAKDCVQMTIESTDLK
jgi:predicted DNA-binding protein